VPEHSYSDWTKEEGWWVVKGPGPKGLALGSHLTFEPKGGGAGARRAQLDGRPWGTVIAYEEGGDFADVDLGRIVIRVRRNGEETPPSLHCDFPTDPGSTGGSWTAEDGSSGLDRHGREGRPGHRPARPRAGGGGEPAGV